MSGDWSLETNMYMTLIVFTIQLGVNITIPSPANPEAFFIQHDSKRSSLSLGHLSRFDPQSRSCFVAEALLGVRRTSAQHGLVVHVYPERSEQGFGLVYYWVADPVRVLQVDDFNLGSGLWLETATDKKLGVN